MNKENSDIINEFLLIGDKFMPEMHLWDPKVKKYSACGPFNKRQQRINEFVKDGRLSHIAKNKLDAACFQHGSAYNKYKNSVNRKKSDIVLKSKAYKIVVDPKVEGVDLADMSLISKFNKGIKYLFCVIDLFSRYAWVVGLKNKKGDSIVERFKSILDSSGRKPNKIWVDHGSEFYNNKFKGFLIENDIEMYSNFNEGKSVVAERFINTL